jgi:prevent-host-death family protein
VGRRFTKKTAGVRELKEQAPKLVQRAKRGERIVITRHERAAAMLVPVSQVGLNLLEAHLGTSS